MRQPGRDWVKESPEGKKKRKVAKEVLKRTREREERGKKG